jgi:hypothetical protein
MKKIIGIGRQAKLRAKEILKDQAGISTFEWAVLGIVGILLAVLLFVVASGIMENTIAPGMQADIEDLFGRVS